MQTFRALIENNLKEFKEINVDLMEAFLSKYDGDEAENLVENEVIDVIDYDGRLHEIIDGMIDIYYYDLRKWAVDNYHFIDDAIGEGLTEGNDFHASIQSGQYVCYQREIYANLDLLIETLNKLLMNEAA